MNYNVGKHFDDLIPNERLGVHAVEGIKDLDSVFSYDPDLCLSNLKSFLKNCVPHISLGIEDSLTVDLKRIILKTYVVLTTIDDYYIKNERIAHFLNVLTDYFPTHVVKNLINRSFFENGPYIMDRIAA